MLASDPFGPISLANRTDPAETVKSRLRYLILRIREFSGLTQKEISNRLETSQPWVSRPHRNAASALPRALLPHLSRLGLGLRLTVPVSGTVELGAPTLDIGDRTGFVRGLQPRSGPGQGAPNDPPDP